MSERALATAQKQSTALAAPARGGILQRKLTIGLSNDPLEQEADRVADRVMAGSVHSPSRHASPQIQRHAGPSTDGEALAPPSVERVLAGSGSSLQPELRKDMEQRFGYDFSWVRVHTGGAAEQSARDVNANAYTVGHDIVFGAGRFAPASPGGQRLIAHELAHVVQQSGADGGRSAQTSGAGNQFLVQRDSSNFPSLSPDVAASWGIPSSPLAAPQAPSNAHATTPGLGPKPGPHTLEETIAAANVDPHKRKTEKETPAPGEEEIMKMTGIQKLSRAVDYAKETFHDDVKGEIAALFTPQAIAGMALFAAVYVAAQLTPAGWVADALALTALTISIIFFGTVLLEIMTNLGIFVSAVNARTDAQLRRSGDALAKALAKASVAIVIALLTRTIKGPSKPYAGPPSEGFADAVTPDGMVVRAPVEAIPKPRSSSPSLSSGGSSGGGKPKLKDVTGGSKDLDEHVDELGDVNAPRPARQPSAKSPVEVDDFARGTAIERQHLDSMPEYTRPKEHNFPGIDGWKGGRETTRDTPAGKIVTVSGADVLQVKSVGSTNPATIRAAVKKGVAGIEGVRFNGEKISVVNPKSRRLDVLFDEGVLTDVNLQMRQLLTDLSREAGNSGVEIRWFRYSSGRKFSIPIP
jgi:hypothetical protein